MIETAHAFPSATTVGVHNHGWALFTQSAADLAFAFNALGIADRLASLELGKPTRFALKAGPLPCDFTKFPCRG